MANCLTHSIDLPAVQALQQRYGSQLQKLEAAASLHLMAALALVAAAVHQDGLSERLDVVLADLYPAADSELLAILQQLDQQMTAWGEAAALAGAIAESLCFA